MGCRFGRQVAWWPMCIRGGGHDGCWHCAGCCCVAVACSWALGGGSSSVVKLFGGRGAIVVVSSRRLMALCSLLVTCDCMFLGLWMRVRARSSSCLAAEMQLWWCRQEGRWHCAVCYCGVVACSWAPYAGFELGRQAAWRPRCNHVGVVKTVDGTVLLLLCCDCVSLGLCVRGSSSVVKLIGGRVQSG